jgi:hypothetical protein
MLENARTVALLIHQGPIEVTMPPHIAGLRAGRVPTAMRLVAAGDPVSGREGRGHPLRLRRPLAGKPRRLELFSSHEDLTPELIL